MKQLKCEMCGSTDIIKQDGVFVCQSCGCKYSVEEAKKMMIEGTVEVQGKVEIDNSKVVENYLKIAKTACDAGNYSETEKYCNMIIENNHEDAIAWFLKGKAAGWQSTLSNNRFQESVSDFALAIDYVDEKDKEEISKKAKEEIKDLSIAVANLRGEQFSKWPDGDETAGFISDIGMILNTISTFIVKTGKNVELNEIMKPIVEQINIFVVQAWDNVIFPEYNENQNDPDERPGKYEWEQFIQRVDYCIQILEQAVLLVEDNEENIQIYKNLIFFQQQVIDSCAWNYDLTDWGEKYWYKEWSLTQNAKNSRKLIINDYESKSRTVKNNLERKKDDEIKQRRKEYWIAHSKEKESLEHERSELEDKVEMFKIQIKEIPERVEIIELSNKIDKLTIEKKKLGFFKNTERKEIKSKIDGIKAELDEVQRKIETEEKKINDQISQLTRRIDKIDTELTKER